MRHLARNCEIGCDHWDPYDSGPAPDDGLDHGGWTRYDDSPWISLMGAEMAAPLAAWLRAEADVADSTDEVAKTAPRAAAELESSLSGKSAPDWEFRIHLSSLDQALAFARLVNGPAS